MRNVLCIMLLLSGCATTPTQLHNTTSTSDITVSWSFTITVANRVEKVGPSQIKYLASNYSAEVAVTGNVATINIIRETGTGESFNSDRDTIYVLLDGVGNHTGVWFADDETVAQLRQENPSATLSGGRMYFIDNATLESLRQYFQIRKDLPWHVERTPTEIPKQPPRPRPVKILPLYQPTLG